MPNTTWLVGTTRINGPRASGLAACATSSAERAGLRPRVSENARSTEAALPAPGQACVFYQGDRVLGGGCIERPMEFMAVGS